MIKQVILVRKDLKMSTGKLAAQVAHAALDAAIPVLLTPVCQQWLKEGSTKIVLGVNNELELSQFETLAQGHGLPMALVQDAGHTEFKEPTVTVLAIGPGESDKIDLITGNLKLL